MARSGGLCGAHHPAQLGAILPLSAVVRVVVRKHYVHRKLCVIRAADCLAAQFRTALYSVHHTAVPLQHPQPRILEYCFCQYSTTILPSCNSTTRPQERFLSTVHCLQRNKPPHSTVRRHQNFRTRQPYRGRRLVFSDAFRHLHVTQHRHLGAPRPRKHPPREPHLGRVHRRPLHVVRARVRLRAFFLRDGICRPHGGRDSMVHLLLRRHGSRTPARPHSQHGPHAETARSRVFHHVRRTHCLYSRPAKHLVPRHQHRVHLFARVVNRPRCLRDSCHTHAHISQGRVALQHRGRLPVDELAVRGLFVHRSLSHREKQIVLLICFIVNKNRIQTTTCQQWVIH